MYQKLCNVPGQIAINSRSSNPTLRALRFKWMRQTLNEQLHISCVLVSESKRENNKENMYEENIFLSNLHYLKFRGWMKNRE